MSATTSSAAPRPRCGGIIGSIDADARARPRSAARHRLGGALAGRAEAGAGRAASSCTARMTATLRHIGDHRHRDRGRPCLRHRPSRHHGRLPRDDRPRGAPRTAAQRARPRHRQRGARHRRREARAGSPCWRPTSIRSPPASPRQNVRLNGASALCPGGHRDRASTIRPLPPIAPFDLIVANILARPLMQLAPEMARHIAPGGSLILSGILDRQRDAVVAAYVGQRFRHVDDAAPRGLGDASI